MSSIIAAMADVFGVVGAILTQITATPILLFFLAASLVPVGLRLFKGLKKAAK